MPGSITIYTNNILETGTLTVTGSADSGFPESRLHDRHISLFWKSTVTEAKNYVVDQGASGNIAVDFLAIESHNFNGIAMQWQYSTTGAWAGEEIDAVTDWTQGDNLQIIKIMGSAETKRYWRLTGASMTDPQCSEIFMGLAFKFDLQAEPAPLVADLDNVTWRRSIGGLERSTKFGDKRKERRYDLFLLNASELLSFRTAMENLDEYSKPFYIKDHEGNYWFARLTAIPREVWDNPIASHVSVSIIEML